MPLEVAAQDRRRRSRTTTARRSGATAPQIDVLDLGGFRRRRPSFPGATAAWSPDGRWIALAEPTKIVFQQLLGGDASGSWPVRRRRASLVALAMGRRDMLLVAGVAVLVAVAAADVVRRGLDDQAAPPPATTHSVERVDFRSNVFPGRLLYADELCEVNGIDLATGAELPFRASGHPEAAAGSGRADHRRVPW